MKKMVVCVLMETAVYFHHSVSVWKLFLTFPLNFSFLQALKPDLDKYWWNQPISKPSNITTTHSKLWSLGCQPPTLRVPSRNCHVSIYRTLWQPTHKPPSVGGLVRQLVHVQKTGRNRPVASTYPGCKMDTLDTAIEELGHGDFIHVFLRLWLDVNEYVYSYDCRDDCCSLWILLDVCLLKLQYTVFLRWELRVISHQTGV